MRGRPLFHQPCAVVRRWKVLSALSLCFGLLAPTTSMATTSPIQNRLPSAQSTSQEGNILVAPAVVPGSFDGYYRRGEGSVVRWLSLRSGSQIPLRNGQEASPKYGWIHIEANHPEANFWNIQEALAVGDIQYPMDRPGIRYYDLDEEYWRRECGPLRRGQMPRRFRVIVSMNDWGDGDAVGIVNAYGNLL